MLRLVTNMISFSRFAPACKALGFVYAQTVGGFGLIGAEDRAAVSREGTISDVVLLFTLKCTRRPLSSQRGWFASRPVAGFVGSLVVAYG